MTSSFQKTGLRVSSLLFQHLYGVLCLKTSSLFLLLFHFCPSLFLICIHSSIDLRFFDLVVISSLRGLLLSDYLYRRNCRYLATVTGFFLENVMYVNFLSIHELVNQLTLCRLPGRLSSFSGYISVSTKPPLPDR